MAGVCSPLWASREEDMLLLNQMMRPRIKGLRNCSCGVYFPSSLSLSLHMHAGLSTEHAGSQRLRWGKSLDTLSPRKTLRAVHLSHSLGFLPCKTSSFEGHRSRAMATRPSY